MKSYHEIANRVFERRDKHIAMQKRKKRIVVGIVTSAALCGVVIIAIFTLWKSGMFHNDRPVIDNPQKMPNNSAIDNNQNNATKPSKAIPTTTIPSNPPVIEKPQNASRPSEAIPTTTIPSNPPVIEEPQNAPKPSEDIPTTTIPSNPPVIDDPQNASKPSTDTPATVFPSRPPIVEINYNIDSIDKINFYSAKKIISENSLFPLGMCNDLSSSPRIMMLNKTYTENPIDRNKIFTTTMVTYFTVELNDEKGFLAQKLGGTGLVEIVVTENDVEDMGQMITFKREDHYYTCFMNGQRKDMDSNKVSREFSSHKYIEGFNIVKNLEQENYKFIVHYEGSKVIGFECASFHSVPTKYVADDVTFIEDFCVVLYTKQTFTIDELEVYFKNEGKREPLRKEELQPQSSDLTHAYRKPKAVML